MPTPGVSKGKCAVVEGTAEDYFKMHIVTSRLIKLLTTTLHQLVKLRLSLAPEMQAVPSLTVQFALTTFLTVSSTEHWTELR